MLWPCNVILGFLHELRQLLAIRMHQPKRCRSVLVPVPIGLWGLGIHCGCRLLAMGHKVIAGYIPQERLASVFVHKPRPLGYFTAYPITEVLDVGVAPLGIHLLRIVGT